MREIIDTIIIYIIILYALSRPARTAVARNLIIALVGHKRPEHDETGGRGGKHIHIYIIHNVEIATRRERFRLISSILQLLRRAAESASLPRQSFARALSYYTICIRYAPVGRRSSSSALAAVAQYLVIGHMAHRIHNGAFPLA